MKAIIEVTAVPATAIDNLRREAEETFLNPDGFWAYGGKPLLWATDEGGVAAETTAGNSVVVTPLHDGVQVSLDSRRHALGCPGNVVGAVLEALGLFGTERADGYGPYGPTDLARSARVVSLDSWEPSLPWYEVAAGPHPAPKIPAGIKTLTALKGWFRSLNHKDRTVLTDDWCPDCLDSQVAQRRDLRWNIYGERIPYSLNEALRGLR